MIKIDFLLNSRSLICFFKFSLWIVFRFPFWMGCSLLVVFTVLLCRYMYVCVIFPVLFSTGCLSMLLRIGCFPCVTVYMLLSPCCCVLVISLCYCIYAVFSMLLLMGCFLYVTVYMLFSQCYCVCFFLLFFMILSPCCCLWGFLGVANNVLFFRIAVYVLFSPYWCFGVLLFMCFI